jgi:hypothetical protein
MKMIPEVRLLLYKINEFVAIMFHSLLESVLPEFDHYLMIYDSLCDLVVRVLGYRSGGPGSIPGTTRKKNNGSGTGSTQPRE